MRLGTIDFMKVRIVTFSLTLIVLSVNSAWANNEAPRISYLAQMCHNSTAVIVKMSLKKNTQNVDDFCGCVANQAVQQHAQKDDHTYALAYHETNIVMERSIRYNQASSDIVRELSKRSESYERDYNISFERLAEQAKPAVKALTYCKSRTAMALGLRGRIPLE